MRRNCLSLPEAAFDEVMLGAEMLVERVLVGARGVIGNDGECALFGDRLPEMVDLIGAVEHCGVGGEAIRAPACGGKLRTKTRKVVLTAQKGGRPASHRE